MIVDVYCFILCDVSLYAAAILLGTMAVCATWDRFR